LFAPASAVYLLLNRTRSGGEDAGKCKVRMKVGIPAEDMDARLDEQIREFQKTAQVRGFRPGRVPRHIVERRYMSKIVEHLRETVVAESFESALRERKLKMVGEPKIEEVKYEKGGALEYEAEIYVLPEIEPPPYKGLRVRAPSVEVDEKEVAAELEKLRKSRAELVGVTDRPTRREDRLLVAIRVSSGDEELFSTDHGYLVVGMASLFGIDVPELPGLLEGKVPDDVVEFEIEVTEKSTLAGQKKEHVGKKARCVVTVREVREMSYPELDDDFAKAHNFASLDEMKKKLAERMTLARRLRLDGELENRLLKALVGWMDVELPDELLQEKAKTRAEYLRTRLMSETDMTEEQIEEQVASQTGKQLEELEELFRRHLLVEAISRREAIFVTEERVDAVIEDYARRIGRSSEELKQEMLESGQLGELRHDMLEAEVKEFVRKHAIVERGDDWGEVERPAAEEAAEEKAADEGSEAADGGDVETTSGDEPVEEEKE